jgi:hypothetical protein
MRSQMIRPVQPSRRRTARTKAEFPTRGARLAFILSAPDIKPAWPSKLPRVRMRVRGGASLVVFLFVWSVILMAALTYIALALGTYILFWLACIAIRTASTRTISSRDSRR